MDGEQGDGGGGVGGRKQPKISMYTNVIRKFGPLV